jgi:type IV pilus assembly protein PilB
MNTGDVVYRLKDEIAQLCLHLGLVDPEIFEQLSKHANNTGASLYDLIQKDNLVSETEILRSLAKKYGLNVSETPHPFRPNLKDFPYNFCYKNGLVPLADDGVNLEVGICVPSSLNSLKNLNLLIGRKVNAKFIALSNAIELLTKRRKDDFPSENQDEKPINSRVHGGLTNQNLYRRKEDQKELISLSGDVVGAVEEIFTHAVESGVSDIHIEIFKDYSSIRFRKNGTLYSIPEYKKFIIENYNAVVARIKILANLDIAERRLPQDGKISFKTKKKAQEVDFRISILPTNLGERVVIRILNSSSLAVSIDKLGFIPSQEALFNEAISAPQGMVLVTGPTGSGKSTTLYGAINFLNKPNVNILTVEDPVEYTVSGISQVQVRDDIGLSFAAALRSFLRQDPEIILVGEIRDAETADIATKAALTGHLVLSTLHTNSALGAINRLINMGLPAYLVSSALSLIVAQRLIRLNCKHCATETEISASLIDHVKELGIDWQGARPMHGKGCRQCANTGYIGRRAVHEVLRITPQIQKAIVDGKSESDLYEIAKEQGYVLIAQVAFDYVKNGEISFEEYLRVVPQSHGG